MKYIVRFPINKKRFFLIFTIVIIIFSLFTINFGNSLFKDDQILTAVILTDVTIAHVGDSICFDASQSRGEIIHIEWDFSDGGTSNESITYHSFPFPGWYNVTLRIIGITKEDTETTTQIGIQPKNIQDESHYGRWFSIDPTSEKGISSSVPIGPNINNPDIEINLVLTQPIGSFSIGFSIRYLIGTDNYQSYRIYSETIILTGNDYPFSYNVNPSDIIEEVSHGDAVLSIVVDLNEGSCGGADIIFSVVFHTDDI